MFVYLILRFVIYICECFVGKEILWWLIFRYGKIKIFEKVFWICDGRNIVYGVFIEVILVEKFNVL